jgi:hypothetical protein
MELWGLGAVKAGNQCFIRYVDMARFRITLFNQMVFVHKIRILKEKPMIGKLLISAIYQPVT